MSELLVIGGFTESKRLLEPVADAAIAYGFGHDAEVLTLHKAMKMDEERMRNLVAGATVLTHSAGIVSVPDARKNFKRQLPADLIAIATPERSSANELRQAAKGKTEAHIFGKTTHPRKAHLRVVTGNTAEMVAHLPSNISLIEPISHFSTMRQLAGRHLLASGRIGNFTMSHDVFYPNTNDAWRNSIAYEELVNEDCVLGELPGSHDELLLNPAGVLRGVREAFEAA